VRALRDLHETLAALIVGRDITGVGAFAQVPSVGGRLSTVEVGN
jgi:hypothetical protein